MFQSRLKNIIAYCFFLGPIFMLIASLFAGLVTNNKAWFGIFGQYGAIMLVPVLAMLIWMVGVRAPKFGTLCLLVGIVGASMGVSGYGQHFSFGLLELIMPNFNANAMQEELIMAMPPEMVVGGLSALLFPLTFILLGIGVWRTDIASKTTAVFITLAGIAFFLGQGVGSIGEAISPVFMILGLFPIGWQLLTADDSAALLPMSATSPVA